MEEVHSTAAHTGVAIYTVGLLGAGLIALVYVAVRWSRWQATRRPLSPWRLGGVDFSLFIVAIVMLTLFSGVIGNAIAVVISGVEGQEPPPLNMVASLSSFLMQAGFILFFLFWREWHRSESEGPVDSQALSPGQIARSGGLLLLACLPIVYLIAYGWQTGLEGLRNLGFDIQIEEQAAIDFFRTTQERWIVGMLVFTAVILAPIGEELVFRAGLYRFLLGRATKPVALLGSGICFGLVHVNLFSFAPLAALGILLALAYEVTGNIKVPIVMHMLFNANTVVLILFFPEALSNS